MPRPETVKNIHLVEKQKTFIYWQISVYHCWNWPRFTLFGDVFYVAFIPLMQKVLPYFVQFMKIGLRLEAIMTIKDEDSYI